MLSKLFLVYTQYTGINYELGTTTLKAIHINHKVSISMCSLKREVKVKVVKFCVGREELSNVYKLTKCD